MAKVVSKSGLAGKLGAAGKKAVEARREDETEFDSAGRLPGDIDTGIAQLIDCRFGQYEKGDNKGEYFFYAAGTVVEPKVHNGIPIAGLRTGIIEPMHETKGRKRESIEDHTAWVLNEMRKLGADTKGATIDTLEELAAEIKDAGPFFRFRTWKGEPTKQYPNPRVNEVWNGQVEYDGDTTAGAVADNSEPGEEPGEPAEDEVVDLEALGEAGDNDDEDAKATLSELAETAGLKPDDFDTWAELATALGEGGDGSGGGDDATTAGDEEPPEPAAKEVWSYKPPKSRKVIEIEILQVNKAKKTVKAKNLEDNKTTYPAIAWDDLIQ